VTLLSVLTLDYQTKRVIAEKLRCSVREAELEINAARLSGAAILSSSDGYRLARTSSEVDACCRRLRIRAAHQFVTARALRSTARRMAAAEHRRPEWPAWEAV
jgi:biotin operon repressor